MSIAGICELVLETDDVGRLQEFYERLGLRVLAEEEDRTWLRVGERCRLGIARVATAPPTSSIPLEIGSSSGTSSATATVPRTA